MGVVMAPHLKYAKPRRGPQSPGSRHLRINVQKVLKHAQLAKGERGAEASASRPTEDTEATGCDAA